MGMIKEAYVQGVVELMEKVGAAPGWEAGIPLLGPVISGARASGENKGLGTYGGGNLGQTVGFLGGGGAGAGVGALLGLLAKNPKAGAILGGGLGGLGGLAYGGAKGADMAYKSTSGKKPTESGQTAGILGAIPGVGSVLSGATAEKGKGMPTYVGAGLGAAGGGTLGRALGSVGGGKGALLGQLLGGMGGGYAGARYGHGDFD